jgi:hypothetical protein
MTSRTFQQSMARLLCAAAVASLGVTLSYHAAYTGHLLDAVGAGVEAASALVASALSTLYAGSAALNGLALLLLVASTHMLFWSQAVWNGAKFAVPGKPWLATLSSMGARAGALGYGFLIASICSHASTRSVLDSMLGLVMLLALLAVMNHKGLMAEHVITRNRGRISDGYEDPLRGIGSTLAAIAVMFLVSSTGCDGLWVAFWGGSYGVASYCMLKRFRLPAVTETTGAACPAHAGASPAEA